MKAVLEKQLMNTEGIQDKMAKIGTLLCCKLGLEKRDLSQF